MKKLVQRSLLTLVAACAAAAPAAAHLVFPSSLKLRPGGSDYIYVADQGTCPATITATSTSPSLLTITAVDMTNGNPLPGGGASVTVANRVDQVFLVTASSMSPSGGGAVQVCWVGADYPNAPCSENNCNPFSPDIVTVTVEAVEPGFSNASSSGWIGDPIGTLGGENFFSELPDFALGGPLPLRMYRNYVSNLVDAGAPQSALGPNWRHSFDWQLEFVGNNLEIWDDKGRLIRFEKGYLKSKWDLALNAEIPFQLVEAGGDFILGDPRDDTVRTFDNAGRLKLVEDGRGNAHSLSYLNGRLNTVGDGLGRTLSFSYGGGGELNSISDGMRSVSFGWDGFGRLASATDTAGKTTTYAYDGAFPADALLTARTLPRGNTPLTQIWDASKRVALQSDAFGNTWSLAYGLPGGGTSATDPALATTVHEHATGAGLTGWIDAFGNSALLGYDAEGRRSAVTDRLGDTTRATYDAISGKPRRITEADGSQTTYSYATRTYKGIDLRDVVSIAGPDGTTSVTYDGSGSPVSVVLPGGATWTFTYNGFGQVLTSTNPEGGVTTLAYGLAGRLTSITDASGNVTTFDYDLLNRVTQVTFDDGSTASYSYDQRDRILTATDGLGRVWTNAFDDNGNLTSRIDPDGSTTSYAYDLLDRLETITNPLGKTTTAYFDVSGRLDSLEDALGNVVGFGYDAEGALLSITDALGETWTQDYDDEQVVTSRITPRGFGESFVSDERGRVTRRTGPLGGVVQFDWDALNRLTRRRDPLGFASNYSYDTDGQVDQIDLPVNGLRTRMGYNGLGQLTMLEGPNSAVWSWLRDQQGRLDQFTDPLGRATSFGYDSNNNPSAVNLAGLGTGSFGYDAGNRLTGASFSDGLSLSYQWDVLDRLELTTNLSLSYDLAGRITDSDGIGATYEDNGLLASLTYAPGLTVSYDYYPNNRLRTVTDWLGGATGFAYDKAGNRVSQTRPNGIETRYSFDELGRFDRIEHVGLADITFARDAAGRITSSSGTWPTSGLPALGSQSFSYDGAYQISGQTWDALGRLLDDGTRSFSWDLGGRLTSFSDGVNSVNLTHDGLGHVTGLSDATRSHEFVLAYQTRRPAVAIEREGGVDRIYNVVTPGGELLHQVDIIAGVRHYPLYDEQNSTRVVTGELGNVEAGFDYTPWGQVTAQTGTYDLRYKWRGGSGAIDLGGVHAYGGSYYDGNAGRFIAPAGGVSVSPLTVDPYALDGGNPLAHADRLRAGSTDAGFGARPVRAADVALLPAAPPRASIANDVRQVPALAWDATGSSVRWGFLGNLLAESRLGNHRKAISKLRTGFAFYKVFSGLSEFSWGSIDVDWGAYRSSPIAETPDSQAFDWETISPRLGLTYAVGAERKTLLRAGYSRFADSLGAGQVVGGISQLGGLGYFDFGERPVDSDPLSALFDPSVTNVSSYDPELARRLYGASGDSGAGRAALDRSHAFGVPPEIVGPRLIRFGVNFRF